MSGRGCGRGSTRTPTGAGCTATLTETARGWDAGGRDAGELYRGSRLVAASERATAHDEDLNALEREFLAASHAASEAEAERRRRANRRLRGLLAGVATMLVLAAVAGVIALPPRGVARDAAITADAQRLGAEALTNERIDQALLLARSGVDLDDSTATRSNLLALLVREPASLGELRGDGWRSPFTAPSPIATPTAARRPSST